MDNKQTDNIIDEGFLQAAQTRAAYANASRFGSAVKEHFVAYSSIDNERGKKLKKGLKYLSKFQLSDAPKERKKNIAQQTGYAAEVKYVARQNAENCINGNPNRTERTDDLVKTDIGGGVNDPIYDHFEIDAHGNLLRRTGEQMKFLGDTPKECFEKLRSKACDKYFEHDATVTVSSDFYDGMMAEADACLEKLNKQLEKAKSKGMHEKVEIKKRQIAKIKKIKNSLKNSGVSKKEALEARLHPLRSTVNDVAKLAHRAGVEQAKIGALTSGAVSIVTNCCAVINGEKDIKEAGVDVAKATGQGAAISYVTAFSASIIKGGMQNAKNNVVRGLSKSNLPVVAVTTTIEIGKTLKKYISGEIDGIECLEELGQKGANQIGAAIFATIGANVTHTVMGGIAGSMFGYALAASCYKILKDSLKDAKIARERRIIIEQECKESMRYICSFRQAMNEHIQLYVSELNHTFDDCFNKINTANDLNDIDAYIKAANEFSIKMGKTASHASFEEFDLLMCDRNYILMHN